jgi:hypothetical protein
LSDFKAFTIFFESKEAEEEDGGGGEGRSCLFDNDEAGADRLAEEGGIDIAEEGDARRDTDGAVEIEVGTRGAVVVVVVVVEE